MEKHLNRAIFIFLGIFGVVYLVLGVQFFKGAMPYYAFDEYEYFLYARSFALTGSLQTPFLEQDAQSIIGNFGAHGFLYALIHGGINKLIGEHWWNIPALNVAMLLLSLAFIFFKYKKNIAEQAIYLFILCIISHFVIMKYIFSYMQEAIQLLFTVVLIHLLIEVERSEHKKTSIILFYSAVIGATLFRANWIFWTWCVFPFFSKRKIEIATLNIVLIVLAGVYYRFTHAPYEMGFFYFLSQKLQNDSLVNSFYFFIDHLIENVYTYFRWYLKLPFYWLGKMMFLGVWVWLGLRQFKKTVPIEFGVWIMIGFQLGAIFTIYDTAYWREVRMLFPSFLLIFFLLLRNYRTIAIALLSLQLVILPWLYTYNSAWIDKHNATFQLAKNQAIKEEFQEIVEYFDEDESPLVMLRRSFARKGQAYLFHLPLLTKEGKPIRYSVYYAPIETVPTKLHDYLLLPIKLDDTTKNVRLLTKQPSYFFYQVTK